MGGYIQESYGNSPITIGIEYEMYSLKVTIAFDGNSDVFWLDDHFDITDLTSEEDADEFITKWRDIAEKAKATFVVTHDAIDFTENDIQD